MPKAYLASLLHPDRVDRSGRPGGGEIARVRKILDGLDAEGRWIEEERISMKVFINNSRVLADYLARMKP